MSVTGVWANTGAFALGLALSLVLTPLALRVAVRTGIFDRPGGYKAQKAPVPYLGGVAIVVAFAVAVALAALAVGAPGVGVTRLAVLLMVAVALGVLGLADDVGKGLNPWFRLAFQTAAGIAVVAAGISVGFLPHPALNDAVTVVWIVGITNAFNLLDNMDGLSAGLAAIAAGFFLVIAVMNGQLLVAPLAAALAGCALGFLRSNFHPARIYMGDAGSLFLGFMLAVIGIMISPSGGQVTFLVPILVLGVAIFDTALVTTTRLLHRRSPFKGGRDHASHRLVAIGLPVPAAVALIYAAAVALGWLALVMARLDLVTGWMLMGLVVAIGLFCATLLGLVPVYETDRPRRTLRVADLDPPAPAAANGHPHPAGAEATTPSRVRK